MIDQYLVERKQAVSRLKIHDKTLKDKKSTLPE